jgi:mercuric ion binding protein
MKKLLEWLCLAPALASGELAIAAPKTVTLSVPGMNCGACPITINKALSKVPGVARTEVNLDNREVTVTFDDARTDVEGLMRATQDAGYSSTVVGSVK